LTQIRPELNKPDTDINAMGGDIMMCCVHGVFWTLILILIETRALRFIDKIFDLCRGSKIQERTDLAFDEDVIEEENRVAKSSPDEMKVRVNKFRKVYTQVCRTPYLAVERTSFGLDYGECFALLGVNGAGKTTTFKSLTGEIDPTAGMITINGMDI
jgi:ABC-type glutathione transport system ATPase component